MIPAPSTSSAGSTTSSPVPVPEPRHARTRVVRRIAADPTSTALLLAAPGALELWPGVRRVGEVGGRALVETRLVPDGPAAAATVRALPPRRTPTAYVTRFTWTGPGLPTTSGTLTLGYAGGTTDAALVLDSAGLEGSTLDEGALAQMAEEFLVNLARAAESRSRAA